ncbi:MAG: pectate lyase [Flaviaesturariibacter sp.]|nr:pectate lyase [Flaviaesturariibacter sp.]
MKFAGLIGLLWFGGTLLSCAQQKKLPATPAESSRAIAFPGAEGFGKYTTGGRGGRIEVVTTLDDSGPGSLRDALRGKEPKLVVFAVSGTIHLQSRLLVSPNTTLAGQTAPGDGICLADYPVSLGGDNIIVRYMRFRMGDKNQKGGMVNGNGSDDAFGGTGRKNIIVDHCSMSWSTDEVFSVYGGDSVTLQWNLVAEPLNYSYHFETGDTGYEHHGYGGIWGGRHLTAHHNLLAHCASRNPRFEGTRNNPEELVDYTNNVLYNWGHNNVYGGEGGQYNVVNNYYRPGPQTAKNVRSRIVNPSKQKKPVIPFGKYYVAGNVVEGDDAVTADNRIGVHMGDGTQADKEEALVATAFPSVSVPPEPAARSFALVLAGVGASFRRDTLDARIIEDVKKGRGRFIDVQGGYPHGTPYEATANAWPALRSLPAPVDSDRDGMPDSWEKANGLNPASAADASLTTLDRHYTNIEVYINQIIR